MLITEAVESAHIKNMLDTLDSTIKFFVGESDNVTLNNIQTLKSISGIRQADELLDTIRLRVFQETLSQQSYAFQRINSQILMSDPSSPDQIKPASAFLLLGQRFVLDSYITGNVVYDRIVYNNQKIERMLPSTLDVLFSLGNDAAAQLLEPELQKYHYASNLDKFSLQWVASIDPVGKSAPGSRFASRIYANCCMVARENEYPACFLGRTAAR
jgi:hypothetical protein